MWFVFKFEGEEEAGAWEEDDESLEGGVVVVDDSGIDKVPPTICLTDPAWRSMQGRNIVIFFL